ncbi:hypothetical protein [Streptomyces sp. NBRC 110035]|uniref:hypothetical protein n=1 Tax=Streptomyces sp. NBRC 110035 TaxID=1547867 RepID=UPI00069628C8|nr:hypothetical protein [Streptomyces sp. NBRC 110035]
MCIRVQYAPRHQIVDPWDAVRQVITIPEDLGATVLFTLRAVRAVLRQLGVPQDNFGALCWCGEDIDLTAAHATQHRQTEVIQVHITQAPATTGRHHAA